MELNELKEPTNNQEAFDREWDKYKKEEARKATRHNDIWLGICIVVVITIAGLFVWGIGKGLVALSHAGVI